MATAGPELAQAAGAAFKVMVIQCGWALTGSKTESRGASGGHGERYAGIGVVPGLGWLGPQVSSVGSGGPGAAFLWTVAVPPLRTSGAEGRNDHCEGSLSPALWALDVMALKMVLRW